MTPARCLILALLCMAPPAVAAAASSPGEGGDGRAGFAEFDVTPPVGIHLGGRGCSDEASTALLDPLAGQVTMLEDIRGSRLCIISLDLIGLGRAYGEELRQRISDRLAIPVAQVLLNCSHTHSGPMMYRDSLAACGEPTVMERAYLEGLADKVIAGCLRAQRDLSPVRASVHEGSALVGINRRGRDARGKVGMIPDPNGPFERRIWILELAGPDGRLRGVLFSYPCHPVFNYTRERTAISADFPGAARRELRAELGDGTHAQFLQGCAGDVRPRPADPTARAFRPYTQPDVDRAGRRLAEAVSLALRTPGRPLAMNIAGRTDKVELPRGEPPPASFYEELAPGKDHRARAARYWLEQYRKGGPTRRSIPWPVGVVRLADDQWICWMSGEPVVEWASLVREWFAGRPVLTLGYTQQVFGYLPVDALLSEGGYEVDSSNHFRADNPAPFAPGLNEAVRETVLRLCGEIASPPSSRPS
jgi:hypothetical protein